MEPAPVRAADGVVKSLDPPSALPAAAAAVVGVTAGVVVLVVVDVLVVGVVVPDLLAVVGVVEPAAVVVVVEGAVVVVVVDEFFFEEWWVVVVVLLEAFFEGVLDPHAAATSPPARTIVPMTHRFPVRLDTVSVPSGLTRLNTYCSSPRCGALFRQTQGAIHLPEHSYRGNLNGTRQNGKLPVS